MIPNIIKSSDGQGGLSLRFRSALLAILPALLIGAKFMGYDISHEEGVLGVELLVGVVVVIEGVVALWLHIYGWMLRNMRKKQGTGAFAG